MRPRIFRSAFLARSDGASTIWREEFIRTYLERDLPQLRVRTPATTLRRSWSMLAHAHGQVWNASEFGRSLGKSDPSARTHLDLLADTSVVCVLQPFHANIARRQVKSPKVYVRDSGLLHTLLGLSRLDTLRCHPRAGASWEGFALGTVVDQVGARPHECYFWGLHGGAELDSLIPHGEHRIGFESKLISAPELTAWMHTAMARLRLQKLWVVHPGNDRIRLGRDIEALSLAKLRNIDLDLD